MKQGPLPFNPIYKSIAQSIAHGLEKGLPSKSLDSLSPENLYKMLSPAPNLKMGHLAFACFSLAKSLKMPPPEIAKVIEENLPPSALIQKALVQGPYLNFFIKNEAFGKYVLNSALKGDLFKEKLFENREKWMIEYSQPNTHKIMHVGHMRNLCLGNALVRLCRYSGIETSAVTYPGDVGTHVAKCLWYYKFHNKEKGPSPSLSKGAWLGEMYTKGHALLEEQRGTDKEKENKKALTYILKQLHDEKGEFYDLWLETKPWSIELMKEVYSWAHIKFDRWFWESEMDAPSLKFAHELFKRGLLKEDSQAIGMDLNDEKLGFCMLVKTDGTGLYATKDIELARKKFEEFGVDKNIYIVDNRQSHHFKQVFKVLEKIGFEKAKDCFHLQYAMVELPDGAMSSRKGNIIPLMDLIEEMEEKVKEQYLQKYLDSKEWTQEEVHNTAKIIANGAIKYGMIRVDNNRKIIFDMKKWLKLDGETGPYLQYVHARIHSLCEKLNYSPKDSVHWDLLKSPQEEALMVKLLHFNNTIAMAVQKLQPLGLCSYLYELGKLFNSFYAECPIGKLEDQQMKRTRLALAHGTGLVMKEGLHLLGIQAPQKM